MVLKQQVLVVGHLVQLRLKRIKNFIEEMSLGRNLLPNYCQTRIKCSRPISSLPGLQCQKPKAHYYFTF